MTRLEIFTDHINRTTTLRLYDYDKLIAEIPYDYDFLVSIIERFKGKDCCKELGFIWDKDKSNEYNFKRLHKYNDKQVRKNSPYMNRPYHDCYSV